MHLACLARVGRCHMLRVGLTCILAISFVLRESVSFSAAPQHKHSNVALALSRVGPLQPTFLARRRAVFTLALQRGDSRDPGAASRRTQKKLGYFDRLKDGEFSLVKPRDAHDFFQRLLRQNCGPMAVVCDERLQPHLLNAIMLLDPETELVVRLLAALGDEQFNYGAFQKAALNIFRTIYSARCFLESVKAELHAQTLSDPAAVAWFLVKLSVADNEVKDDALVQEIVALLKSNNEAGTSELAVLFSALGSVSTDGPLQPMSLPSAKLSMRPPGVREHDNDPVDFRKIQILPTPLELQCTEPPYLPPADGNPSIENQETAMLDRHFRLLREDLLGTLREEIRENITNHSSKGKPSRPLFPGPRIASIDVNTIPGAPGPSVVIRFDLPDALVRQVRGDAKRAKQLFEKGSGRRLFETGKLVIVLQSHKSDGISQILPVAVGVITCRRELVVEPSNASQSKSSRRKRKKPMLEMQIKASFPEDSLATVLSLVPWQRTSTSRKENVDRGLYLASPFASFFAFEPVLRSLQTMNRIPMDSLLLRLNTGAVSPPKLSHGGKELADFNSELREAVAADPTQRDALQFVFDSRVVLVQGPPGTGKSYVGKQIVKAMIFAGSKWPQEPELQILCLCRTNHALDSFLQALMDDGIPEESIVRLGQSPRISKRLQARRVDRMPLSKFNAWEGQKFFQLKERRQSLHKNLAELEAIVNASAQDTEPIERFLKTEYPEAWEQLFKPKGLDERVRKVPEGYLWRRWRNGEDRGVCAVTDLAAESPHGQAVIGDGLWKLNPQEREETRQEWMAEVREHIVNVMTQLDNIQSEISDLRMSSRRRFLEVFTIIGSTTVNAAKQRNLLLGLAPSVVLVEEAGEILESELLTCLGDRYQQLILIGDHKQLRPSTENFQLRRESGNGFDLDESLFERLAFSRQAAPKSQAKLPPLVTLGVQHRMRPEISSLVRGLTYPHLQDHECTLGRPHVKGVTRDVVFVDHRVEEQNDEDGAVAGSKSKVNQFEAQMVVRMAVHLAKQENCDMSNITILTPYLGQLIQIQKELTKMSMTSSMSERDQTDVIHLGLQEDEHESNSPANCNKLRIATVDNYQGEEADIVIVSLVRSNRKGQIGFLRSTERVNVMLSRARLGLYVVGNRDTLTNCRSTQGRNLWQNVFNLLEEQQAVFNFFPARCEKHRTIHRIEVPSDFDKYAPDGGCNLPCSHKLPCGHWCNLKCHPKEDAVHPLQAKLCSTPVPDVCQYGHKVVRTCSTLAFKCHKQVTWECSLGHTLVGKCHRGRPMHCSLCEQLEKLEKDDMVLESQVLEKLAHAKEQLLIKRQQRTMFTKRVQLQSELNHHMKEFELLQQQLQNTSETAEESHRNQMPWAESLSNPIETAVVQLDRAAHDDEQPPFGDDSADCANQEPNCTTSSLNTAKHEMDQSASAAGREAPTDSAVTQAHLLEGDESSESIAQPDDQGASRDPAMLARISADIATVLQSYGHAGAVKADNVLDGVLREWGRKMDGTLTDSADVRSPAVLDALRFLLRREVNPTNAEDWAGWMEWHPRDPLACPRTECLPEAVCCWAKSTLLRRSHPLLARDLCSVALGLLGRQDVVFPTAWSDEMKRIQEEEVPVFESIETAATSRPHIPLSRQKWDRVQQENAESPTVMEEVLGMTGIEAVKLSMIDLYHRIQIAQEQDDVTAASYNIRFEGGPGTGKTTVARHYATLLQQLTVLSNQSIVVETSGAELIHEGVRRLQSILDAVQEAGGGVIFIDETYQLSNDMRGRQVLDLLLPLAESLDTKYGPVVWVFAGYPKDMEKLFEHNPGMPSRFPHRFVFEDFSDDELLAIFFDLCTNKPKPKPKPKPKNLGGFVKIPSPPAHKRTFASFRVGGIRVGAGRTDKFGVLWTFDGNSWTDKYNNKAGYDPADLGTDWNPLLSSDGMCWCCNRSGSDEVWTNEDGEIQSHRPGTKVPGSNRKTVPRENPFWCREEKHVRIAIRRLPRQRGNPAFGNARSVRSLLEQVKVRQAARIEGARAVGENPDLFEFTRDDLLGPVVTVDSLRSSETYRALQEMEGLAPVKEEIDQLIKLVAENQRREAQEKPLLDVVLNRIFLGNPGTGKTAVAALYAKLLGELGLLSRGEVMLKAASDFVGSALGSSEQLTRDILRAAEGNVLVIDEAHSLYSGGSSGSGSNDPYKTGVIDTIVEQVQARPGDDRAVVLLGYEEEMTTMLKNVNPGLSRRFQIENSFRFPDFSDEALLRILLQKANQQGLELEFDVAKAAIANLAKARAKPHFGNAGAVENLLSVAKVRCPGGKLSKFDFGVDTDGPDEQTLSTLFDDLIGIEDVRESLEALRDTVVFAQQRGDNATDYARFGVLFMGSPGTGKTTVARRMGEMYTALGLLADSVVKEVSASDLVTGYAGQAGKKTRDVLSSSSGGVLFIDEAYQLDPARGGPYMTEAVDELVKLMTSTDFQNKVLIILAGYEEDMERMLNTNPGLKSRFPERLHFRDFDAEAVKSLLTLRLERRGLKVEGSDEPELDELCKTIAAMPEFANGRDVDTWSKLTYQKVASRCKDRRGACLEVEDLKQALAALQKSRHPVQQSLPVAVENSSHAGPRADGTGKPSLQDGIVAKEHWQQAQQDPAPVLPAKLKAMHRQNIESPEFETETAEKADQGEDSWAVEDEQAADTQPQELQIAETKTAGAFDSVDHRVLKGLQSFLDVMGLSSKDGVSRLKSWKIGDKEYQELVRSLQAEVGLTPTEIEEELSKWREAQTKLAEMEEKEVERKKAHSSMEAIWRCAVCGRADKPWIACHVAPYIVGYRRRAV